MPINPLLNLLDCHFLFLGQTY